jgi:phage tail-like protein
VPVFSSEKAPLLASRFAVELQTDKMIVATFTECSGLSATIEVETYHEGGQNRSLRKFPGKTDYGNLVLKRVRLEGPSLLDWFVRTADPKTKGGKSERQNVSVILFDQQGHEQARWEFEKAFPVKWNGPTLQGTGNAVAIESIELAHEGLIATSLR